MNYYKESEILWLCKDYKCSFRVRKDKIYLTITGAFDHYESKQIRSEIERIVGNKIYMTSGGFSCLPKKDGRMTLRLNPDAKMLQALNY